MDLAIVNRTFWPHNQVIGEALLQFAEKTARNHRVCVIAQSQENIRRVMADAGRGKDVKICDCRAHTDSASSFFKRALESIYFMLWVAFNLVRERPRKVYVATDPPVLVPFIIFLYCKVARASYYYHLQDIHPEATDIVIPLNRLVMGLLRSMDNLTMRNARSLITLSIEMRDFIVARSRTQVPVALLDNSAFDVEPSESQIKSGDIVFCGNAGRLQRIPLLVSAISTYSQQGGKLRFTFVGAGVYGPNIAELAQSCDQVDYLGYLPAAEAASIVSDHRWALLPIDDEVTRYAFPSKSSSYALSGCGVLAICGMNTSVARWVQQAQVGLVCEPNHEDLVRCFHELEQIDVERFGASPELLHSLKTSTFVERLLSICDIE